MFSVQRSYPISYIPQTKLDSRLSGNDSQNLPPFQGWFVACDLIPGAHAAWLFTAAASPLPELSEPRAPTRSVGRLALRFTHKYALFLRGLCLLCS